MSDFKFENKVWLSSPTMHGEELEYMKLAYDTNWMTTLGENIDTVEEHFTNFIGCKHAIGLSSGTAALHLAIKLAGEKAYGMPKAGELTLTGKNVFCSNLTFSATVNPVVYEGGCPIFVDSERDTWNMDPAALEKAFEIYPDTRIVVVAHLYGTPGKIAEIKKVCDKHGAIIVEDAAESLGATYNGQQTGTFGDYNVISFNGNKIITGSSGGMLLTDDDNALEKVKKWSTQSREDAPWYHHEELGYNYRMSNVIAGVIRGQVPHLQEHIDQKTAIYNRYKEGLSGLPLAMNPFDENNSVPNFWLSCILIDVDAMCDTVRGDRKAMYRAEVAKSCPTEIMETLMSANAESRPIWKPMHLHPYYRRNPIITAEGEARARSNAYRAGELITVSEDIFNRGLCLPTDNKMELDVQDKVIEIIKSCF